MSCPRYRPTVLWLAFLSLSCLLNPLGALSQPITDPFARDPLPPTQLKAVPVDNPLGLQLLDLTFHWQVASDQDAVSAWQVLVASSRARLNADYGDLWDSGKRFGAEHDRVRYGGLKLPRDQDIVWKVRVWNADGQVGPYSSVQSLRLSGVPDPKPVKRKARSSGDSPRYVEGKTGQGLALEPGKGGLRIEDYPALQTPEGLTFSVWIRPETTKDGWQTILRKEDGKARRLLALGRTDDTWGIWIGLGINGSYREYGAPYDKAKLGDKEWHHVAGSYDGKTVSLYVDGQPIGKASWPGSLDRGTGAPTMVGYYLDNREPFHGGIDDLRVYNRPLNAEAIQELARGGKTVAQDHLVCWLKLDGNLDNESLQAPEPRRNRVGFLGNQMIADMRRYGFLETALTVQWPQDSISFRNLGWPADDVFGVARSEFGSSKNTRSWQPPNPRSDFGYETRMQHVRQADPTTLLVAYGAEAAYYESQESTDRFQATYVQLLEDLEAVADHLILLGPLRQENRGGSFPDPALRNQRLKATSEFIRGVARKRGHRFVDLFAHVIPEQMSAEGYLTDNGIHLNERGHARLAQVIMDQLGLGSEGGTPQLAFSAEGNPILSRSARIDRWQPTARGFRVDVTPDRHPAPAASSVARLTMAKSTGDHLLRIDGQLVRRWNAGAMPDGLEVPAGDAFNPTETLRQVIIEKNQLHRYRLRPLNKTYIFLFRRYEMGHLAYEMGDFDRLVEDKESLIARLRVPGSHQFVVERIDPWKTPRAYPDHEVPKHIPDPDPDAELHSFTVAKGFDVSLFAANPMIANPINLNWDTQGRYWVSTSSTYPHIKPGVQPNDRIVILEDVDQDGRADRSTVFAEGLLVPHSVMPVPGGAYVCSSTEFLFLADKDGDGRSESRRVIYSGFGNADVHHMIHGLRWAPWGELFFLQSIYINTFIETPFGPRRLNGSGLWRFRPETERMEVFGRGMVNPWGHDFDAWGQSFATDGAGGAGPHHVFPGAAFRTAVGSREVLDGLIPGKPKNTAAEFVDGRHAPDHWQGSLLANDFRANRTVRYEITEKGSGYAAREVETVLHSKHRSFRPVDIKIGPEGAIYVVDWYNPIIDHGEVDFHHPRRDKSHGRIWRLTAKGRPLVKRPVIAGAPVSTLLDYLKAPESWTRIQANRELAGRGADAVVPALDRWLSDLDSSDPSHEHHQLEALWLKGALNAPDGGLLRKVATAASHQARAAAVRMMFHWHEALPGVMDLFAQAVADDHPRVRLEAISVLREMDSLEACNLAMRALDYPGDKYIDYALRLTAREMQSTWLPALQSGRPVFEGRAERIAFALNTATDKRALEPLVSLIRKGQVPDRLNALRLVASLGGESEMDMVFQLAVRETSVPLLRALSDAARTNPSVPKDTGPVLKLLDHGNADVRMAAAELAGRWKVTAAAEALKDSVSQSGRSADERLSAGRALARLGQGDALSEIAGARRSSEAVRVSALVAWAETDPARSAPTAVSLLSGNLTPSDAEAVVKAYTVRKEGPKALAQALEGKKLKPAVAAGGIRTALASGLDLAGLVQSLTRAGSLQPVQSDLSPAARAALLTEARQSGNFKRGAEIYQRQSLACATCHALGGKGGKVGPELGTLGTYMTPESILESLLNPSTTIKQGYETVVVTLKDDELVTGILQRKTDTAVLLRDGTSQVQKIPNREVERIDSSAISLMPAGLTSGLRRDELLDLLHYLTNLGKQ